MYKTSTEIKVGLFVLAALGVLVWMAFKLGGFRSYDQGTYRLDAVFDQVSGLKPGVGVQLAGINVGTVVSIELYGSQALVIMAIRDQVSLPADSRAFIKAQGVLGDKYVELDPGDPHARPMVPGQRIESTQSAADLSELLEKLGGVADDLKSLTSALAADGGGQDLKDIVLNVKELSGNLNALTKENGPGLTRSLASLERAANNLESITSSVNEGRGTLGQLINDDSAMVEFRGALSALRDVAEKLSSGQGTLGRLINDDTTVTKIDEALTSVNEFLEKGDEIKVAVDFRADWMTRYNFLKSTVNLKIQTSPDRWYVLGVTGDYFGSYARTDYTSGGDSWMQESRERGKLKFNAQIAQRFYDVVVRGGVFESGGGLALDWLLLDEDLILTLEAFSGDFDHRPHLRGMAYYRFWKFLYAGAGYDDFLSEQHRSSPFFSLGLMFSDDDLRYLLNSGASSLLD